MPLPRPARLLKQYPSLLQRLLTPSASARMHARPYAAAARRVIPSDEVEVDESYRPFLNDMDMRGSSSRTPGQDSAGTEFQLESAPELLGDEGQEEGAPEWEPRKERRSPAAVLGSKRIGLVVLPDQLVDGIQREINGTPLHLCISQYRTILRTRVGLDETLPRHPDPSPPSPLPSPNSHTAVSPCPCSLQLRANHAASDPRDIRTAFLTLNPSTSPSSRRSSSLSGGRARKASEEEQRQRSSAPAALAKAAAFLPGEYAAVRNVLREMRVRLGDEWLRVDGEEGGVLEVSGSLGSGVWAMADVLGHLEEKVVSEQWDGAEGEGSPEGPPRAGMKEGLGYQFVHSGRAGIELAGRLFEGMSNIIATLEHFRPSVDRHNVLL